MSVTTVGTPQIRDSAVTPVKVSSGVIVAAGTNAFSGNQSMGGNKLTNVGAATTGGDVPNWTQIQNLLNGIKWKDAVRAATTAAGDLTTDFEDGDVVDGVTLATGDRLLVKNQADPTENGIYVVAASGAPARAVDADSGAELVSAQVPVTSGTANADKVFTCTNDSITLGSTSITFTALPSVIGALIAANNLSDVASVSTARTNLGLGTGDSPQFTAINLGHASDTTLTRTGAGDIAVEGNAVYRAGGTDVPVTDGGTGSSTASGARTNLGATTVGANIFTVTNPSAVRFLKVNADNSVTLRTAAEMLSDLGAAGGTFAPRETPSGTVNGSNDTFTLAHTPTVGTEEVYVNGILQDSGSGNDYTISAGTITFESGAIPASGDKVRVSYWY